MTALPPGGAATTGSSVTSGEVLERVRGRLIRTGSTPSSSNVAEALRAEGMVLGDAALMWMVTALRAELAGAGPLEQLLRDESVTDVLVNGPESVWIDRGAGLEPAGVTLRDEVAVRRLAQRMAGLAGRRLDEAAPYVDARLPDGSRLHAVIPPVAPRGTCLSIRVPRKRAFTLSELVEAGSLPPAGVAWLRALVLARVAFLVSGGTGAGKTTLLNCLLSSADPGERMLIVEDSSELEPVHPHVVRLESRPPNVEGAGAVSMRDLVRQALRMRPDRLVVGEVRGAEVVDLLAALNTGHEGGCGTLHANSAADVPARLEALALAAGLGREALHAQVAAGVDAVVHVGRRADGSRAVAQLCVLSRAGDLLVRAVPALTLHGGELLEGPGAADLRERLGRWAP